MHIPLFAFELGREYRLSLAEIWKVFPGAHFLHTDQKIALLTNITRQEILKSANRLWGTIKIMEMVATADTPDIHDFLTLCISQEMQTKESGQKISFALNVYWLRENQKNLIMKAKKSVQESGFNARFINKDWRNIPSVQIVKEALIAKKTDWNLISDGEKHYFWISLFVQDIYGYSNRDYDKERNMHIGMLPPKLAQMMINLTGIHPQTVYDPFVGLGTIGIESALAGNTLFFGSDHNDNMVQASFSNLEKISETHPIEYAIFHQDARFLHEIDIWNEVDSIVTEGYLGEIMTQKNITLERIWGQRKKLSELYSHFFENLAKTDWKGILVISFPFWNFEGKHVYFEEIYTILKKYVIILPLLPEAISAQVTRSGSLLYKRKEQLVGREIFCLKMKE